jgi:ABC-type amino acid transport substrate-binding protein
MKKFFCFFVLLLLSFPTLAQYKGDSWEKVKKSGSGTLTVVYSEQPGLIQNIDGKMKGVCVDILTDFSRYVKTKYGKDVTVKYAGEEKDFANFLKVVQTTPNILGVTNTSITEDRKKIMKFTPTFLTSRLVLLTNDKAPSIKSLNDLPKIYAGFDAEVITGSTHVKYMEKIKKDYYPDLKITYAPSSESIIKNLKVNTRMFSILDFTEYVGIIRRKLPVKRQEVELGDAEPLGFIMSKQSDWDIPWNEFLTPDYRKSVEYKKIIAENLGSTFLSLVR